MQTMLKKWPKGALGNITETVNQQVEKANHEILKAKGSDGGSKKHRNGYDRRAHPMNPPPVPAKEEGKIWMEVQGGYPSFNNNVDSANDVKDREVTSYYAVPLVKRRWRKKTRVGDTS